MKIYDIDQISRKLKYLEPFEYVMTILLSRTILKKVYADLRR